MNNTEEEILKFILKHCIKWHVLKRSPFEDEEIVDNVYDSRKEALERAKVLAYRKHYGPENIHIVMVLSTSKIQTLESIEEEERGREE